MKVSEFVFDYIYLFYYKTNPSCGGSYIDSLDWIKTNKKTKTNSISNKDKCFQYTVTVMLNHEEILKDLQRITTKPFINKYNWEGINFTSGKDDWKKLRKMIEQLFLMF